MKLSAYQIARTIPTVKPGATASDQSAAAASPTTAGRRKTASSEVALAERSGMNCFCPCRQSCFATCAA